MIQKRHLLSLLLICVSLSASLFSAYAPQRVNLRHIEWKGLGYDTGYTTLEAFYALEDRCYTPFFDARIHVLDDGRFASNLGLGARTMWGCRSYGLNLYYDYRLTRKRSYNQIGIGFESLGEMWEFRANGYLPVAGTKSHFFGNPRFERFVGNSLLISRKRESAMQGVDAEIGARFSRCGKRDLYVGAGPYYFKARDHRHGFGKDAFGGKVRVAGRFSDYFAVEVSGSYDRLFHGIVQAQVGFTYPFGPANCCDDVATCCNYPAYTDRLYQPVIRNEIIVTEKHRIETVAIDPLTNAPFRFIFVDNTSSSLGTFESPFPTLLEAQNASNPHDIIYVFPGDGTSTGMNAGITLKDYQLILGSGRPYDLLTTAGNVTIPALTVALPLVTNVGGNVVTLANRNAVSGLHIGESNFGISGMNLQNTTIINNIFTTPAGQIGVGLDNVVGNVYVLNNVFSTDVIDQNTVGFTMITDMNIANIFLVNNNFVNHAGNAATIFGQGSTLQNITVRGNNFTAPVAQMNSNGIIIFAAGFATTNAFIENNVCTNHEASGIGCAATGNSHFRPVIQENTVICGHLAAVGSSPIGIICQAADAGVFDAIVHRNTVTGAKQFGIGCVNQGTNNCTTRISQNKVSNSGLNPDGNVFGGGIAVAVLNSGNLSASICENVLAGNQNQGGVFATNLNIGGVPNPGVLCVRLINNISDTGYRFYNADFIPGASKILLEETYTRNIGPVFFEPVPGSIPPGFPAAGSVTIVPPCTCGPGCGCVTLCTECDAPL